MCPISHEMYVDPVTTILGHTYERAYIERWFEKHSTDPLTMEYLSSKFLTPNRSIKSMVEDFKKSTAALHLPAASSTSSTLTDQDREMASAIWMEEMERANQTKHSRLNLMEQEIHKLQEGMAAIEFRIVECIPEDIIEQLASLERSSHAADRKKAEVLREKQLIEGSPPALQYYVAMQVSINGTLTACTAISSDMVANQSRGVAGSIAAAIETFGKLANPIPFAEYGLDLLKTALNMWDERQQKLRVDRVQNVFLGDSAVISLVAEGVARGMALHRKAELEEAAKKQQKGQKGPAFRHVKEELRKAVALCLSRAESDPSKVRATADAQTLLQAMMDGTLTINAGTSSSAAEKAAAITDAAVAFVRSKRF